MTQPLNYFAPRRRRSRVLIAIAVLAIIVGPARTYHNVQWLIAANEHTRGASPEALESWYRPSMRLFRGDMWLAAVGGLVLAAAGIAFLFRSRFTWALLLVSVLFEFAYYLGRVAESLTAYLQSTETWTHDRAVTMFVNTSAQLPGAAVYLVLLVLLTRPPVRAMVRYASGIGETAAEPARVGEVDARS